MMRRVLCLTLLLGCGCFQPTAPRVHGYTGPTEPLAAVVQSINHNNSRINTVWSKGYFEANIIDGDKKSFVNGDVFVLYRKPDEIKLVGKKDLAGEVFQIGSNHDMYWLTVKGDVDTMWYGTHAFADRVDPKQMPIQPQLILEVLGLGEINTDLTQLPAPILRFNNDADAYMLVWNVKLPDRWAAQKEIWFDRTTKLPKLVLLFDINGRVILRAYLAKHRAIPMDGVADSDRPMIACDYRLYFPETGSTMTINLSELESHKGPAPNDKSFEFPGKNAGVQKIVQVDSDERPR